MASAQQASHTMNSLTTNSLTTNSLTTNSLTTNSLTANSLSTSSITGNSLIKGALVDAKSQEVFKYIVSCALPASAHVEITIDNVVYGYEGGIGVAPGWADANGSCDDACIGWVSACVLSRVNYRGDQIDLSVRGTNDALASTQSERTNYSTSEATYYGNIFSSPQQRYMCLAPGKTSDERVCGPSLNGCVVTNVGQCGQVCDPIGADGSFSNCGDQQRANNSFPTGTQMFPGTVTVFLLPPVM